MIRSRVGQPHVAQHLGRPRARLRLGHPLVEERHLHQLLADLIAGFSEAIGSW